MQREHIHNGNIDEFQGKLYLESSVFIAKEFSLFLESLKRLQYRNVIYVVRNRRYHTYNVTYITDVQHIKINTYKFL